MLSGVERAFAKATGPPAGPVKPCRATGQAPRKLTRVFVPEVLLCFAFQSGALPSAQSLSLENMRGH